MFGANYSLGVLHDEVDPDPHMAITSNYSGQRWYLMEWFDEYFKLTNEYVGAIELWMSISLLELYR
jgi:hypothetical protein